MPNNVAAAILELQCSESVVYLSERALDITIARLSQAHRPTNTN